MLSIQVSGFHTLARKYDPTGTLSIRSMFSSDLRKRFSYLKKRIKEYVFAWSIPRDAFKLRINAGSDWDFTTNPAKLTEFLAWLKEMEDEGVLSIQQGPVRGFSVSSFWADKYIMSAYKKGALDAYKRANYQAKTGMEADQYISSAFFAPIHADALALLYTRVFTELKGVVGSMDQRISRTLAQGLADGLHPRVIAQKLAAELDWGLVRAERVARTEIIRAHAESTLNSYESFGIEGVEVEVEWLSAGDDGRTCPHCLEMSGKVFTIKEARGMIPAHVSCRCCFIPVLP